MAYGADWLVYDSSFSMSSQQGEHDEEKTVIVEAAASCSFYDQAMYLWDTSI
jgi:hypothetical protein